MSSNSITDIFTNAYNSSSSAVSGVRSSVMSYDYFSNNSLFIGLFIVIAVCIIIAYFLYKIISEKLFLNIRTVVDETKIPIVCTTLRKYKFDIRHTGNGERRSFTFWIYIHDMNRYSSQYKNVWSIKATESDATINNASPFIFLDKVTNRLYVHFAKTSTSPSGSIQNTTHISRITEQNLDEYMTQGIVIPYVPLQRWVHIAIVCNANSYKSSISAYVDADLVNVVSHGEGDKHLAANPSNPTHRKNFNELNINLSGYVHIGGNVNEISGVGFSGLVSKITSFNYDINPKDIYYEYYKGPVNSFFAALGLGNYGIRNPIYKIEST
jgi:hypothetical protein